MRRTVLTMAIVGLMTSYCAGQDFHIGGPTFGGGEPLYAYDAPEPWKHGWLQVIPSYGGYHSFRPYNYKQVLSQSAQASAWGMPRTMPYSQQYYHRYETLTRADLHSYSALPAAPHGPHPSAMYQPQWNALRQSQLLNTGLSQQRASDGRRSVAPVEFQNVHQIPASGPEIQRSAQQQAKIQRMLQETTQDIGAPAVAQPSGWRR